MSEFLTRKTFDVPPFGLGAVEDKHDPRDFKMAALMKAVGVFPPTFSHLSKMSPIRNQGQRGACVSFGTVAVKEWQEKKQRKLKTFYDLSEEFVYDQIKLPGGGAFMRDAFKAVYNTGVCQEKMLPYINVPDQQDSIIWKPSKTVLANAKNYKVESYARIESIDEICQSIAVNGPCITGIPWAYDWFWPDVLQKDSDGFPVIKTFSGGVAGGHCITLVGYDYPNRTFTVRNQWGESWGYLGYVRMSFDIANEFFFDTWGAVDVTSKKINQGTLKELKQAV